MTPTPSRLDAAAIPAGLTLKGPETDLEMSVRPAEVVHFTASGNRTHVAARALLARHMFLT